MLGYGIIVTRFGTRFHYVSPQTSALKIDAVGFCEILITTCHTIQCHNAEDRNINLDNLIEMQLFIISQNRFFLYF
jgi:hypothetical protein